MSTHKGTRQGPGQTSRVYPRLRLSPGAEYYLTNRSPQGYRGQHRIWDTHL